MVASRARFAGNSEAIAENSNAAAAAEEQPNVAIILTRVLSCRRGQWWQRAIETERDNLQQRSFRGRHTTILDHAVRTSRDDVLLQQWR